MRPAYQHSLTTTGVTTWRWSEVAARLFLELREHIGPDELLGEAFAGLKKRANRHTLLARHAIAYFSLRLFCLMRRYGRMAHGIGDTTTAWLPSIVGVYNGERRSKE